MQETQRAKTAYADYLAMGPGRSLEKLWEEYKRRTRSVDRTLVPTLRLPTLQKWSSVFGWQARVAAFEVAINEQKVRDSFDEIERARQENLRLVREAKKTAEYPKLDALVKLEMQLLGAPLADKHEVEHSGEIGFRLCDYDDLSDEDLDALAGGAGAAPAED